MANVDISKMLSSGDDEKTLEKALYDVLKDLTSVEKQKLLSELNNTEISLITRLKTVAVMRKNKTYDHIAELFMVLKSSKDRKSRTEILKAIKNAHPENRDGNAGFEKLRQVLS